MENAYICIDLKSYYASVECVFRGLDPLRTNLLVADETRSDQTICLAVSPPLKAIGVPSRPRLFEAKRAIEQYEKAHRTKVDYIIARPRMAEYERISVQIYSIYLRYAAAEDVHIYSIDECFIDCTPYLHLYREEAERGGVHPAHLMAMTMIRDVLRTTGITATVGIGTNLYLAKVAMDIVAKKRPADRDGVRIAELNEDSYKFLLWDHRPLTDFWQIGPGKARRLMNARLFTMGDVARRSLWDEEFFYRNFGVDGEILVDHAWGIEPVTMRDIKAYKSEAHSLSSGQVLPRAYNFEETRLVISEMTDELCARMFRRQLLAGIFTWWVSYDPKSLDVCPDYEGPVVIDFYGRPHPKHANGVVRLPQETNSAAEVGRALLASFDKKADPRLLFRRLGVAADRTVSEDGAVQLSLFTDYAALEKEAAVQTAMGEVRRRFGPGMLFKGKNLLDGSTALERGRQIGGHRA